MATRIRTYTQQEEQQQRAPGQPRPEYGNGTIAPSEAHVVEGGSFAETVAGAGGVTLGILGLAGVLPVILATIATMAVGVGLFVSGGTIAARTRQLEPGPQGRSARRQIMAGLGMEALAGLGGAALGLLALLGVSPMVLMGVAAIVLGGALLMASAAQARLEGELVRNVTGQAHHGSHEAVNLASGSDFLVGGGAIVLGILSLTGWAPLTLILVSMLSIGAAGMMNGSTLAARFFTVFGY